MVALTPERKLNQGPVDNLKTVWVRVGSGHVGAA